MILKKGLASIGMREVDGRQSSNARRFLRPFRLEGKGPNGEPCRSFPRTAIQPFTTTVLDMAVSLRVHNRLRFATIRDLHSFCAVASLNDQFAFHVGVECAGVESRNGFNLCFASNEE
jgi:hypothetical protein